MTHLRSNAASRTLTVVLSETDWRALRAVEPDAVGWLQQRIRERIGTPETEQKAAPSPRPSTTPTGWGDDVY
jgi:hypothetical protein